MGGLQIARNCRAIVDVVLRRSRRGQQTSERPSSSTVTIGLAVAERGARGL